MAGDEARRAVLDGLSAALGPDLVGSEVRNADLFARVRPEAWRRVAEICRDRLGFNYFCHLSGIDWMPHTWPNPKVVAGEAEPAAAAEAETPATGEAETPAAAEPTDEPAAAAMVTGVAGGDTRFQVFARLYSIERRIGITLKADLDETNPRVATWTQVFPGADWCERETAEMYGFGFDGHPNLVKLYLPGEFEGFPLRKDFALLSREVKPWPGLVDVEQFPPGTGGDEE